MINVTSMEYSFPWRIRVCMGYICSCWWLPYILLYIPDSYKRQQFTPSLIKVNGNKSVKLQRCQLSIVASQSTACRAACSGYPPPPPPPHSPFAKGIHRWRWNFPQKMPIIRNTRPRHDVNILLWYGCEVHFSVKVKCNTSSREFMGHLMVVHINSCIGNIITGYRKSPASKYVLSIMLWLNWLVFTNNKNCFTIRPSFQERLINVLLDTIKAQSTGR